MCGQGAKKCPDSGWGFTARMVLMYINVVVLYYKMMLMYINVVVCDNQKLVQ